MKRYRFEHITSSGRGVLFWMPWGFGKWLLRVTVFALCLLVFILLFCLPQDRDDGDDGPIDELHEGDVEITLKWSTADDLDLHCIGPDGEEIFYQKKQSSTGGTLDKDMNVDGGHDGSEAVEHIYWPRHAAPLGDYKISVVLYKKYSRQAKADFSVRFKAEGCRIPVDTILYETVVRQGEVNLIGTFRVE